MGCEAATRDDPVVRTAVAEAIERHRSAGQVLGIEAKVIPAKQFLQEDQAPAVADAIAGLATSA